MVERLRDERRVVVLGDYENFALGPNFYRIDWEKLRDIILEEIGEIDFAFIFAPSHCLNTLPEEINDWGFEAVVCQKRRGDSQKLEDTADIHIIRAGMKFLHYKEITDIVILGSDLHMAELIREAKLKKVKVHMWSNNDFHPALVRIMPEINKFPLKPQ